MAQGLAAIIHQKWPLLDHTWVFADSFAGTIKTENGWPDTVFQQSENPKKGE